MEFLVLGASIPCPSPHSRGNLEMATLSTPPRQVPHLQGPHMAPGAGDIGKQSPRLPSPGEEVGHIEEGQAGSPVLGTGTF